jgi:hypothetical protein
MSDNDIDTDAPSGMPEGVPAQFWNAETGQVDMPGMAKHYGELAAFKAQQDERHAGLPQKPEDYRIEGSLPQGFMVPHGFEPRVDPKDPRIPALREFAHKHRLPQEAVNALVSLDLQAQVAAQMEADAELQAEFKKLGENGKARVKAVETALALHLSEAEYEAIRPFTGSAVVIAALEKIIAKAGPLPAPNGGMQKSAPERPADKFYGKRS